MEDKLLELGFEEFDIGLGGALHLTLENVKLVYYIHIKEFVVYDKNGVALEGRETMDKEEMLVWIKEFSPKQLSLRGKVQTNEHGTNVIVETEVSNGTHDSHYNKPVIITQILTDEEVIIEGKKAMEELDPVELVKIYKKLLKVKDGFATSNCSTPKDTTELTHSSGDIMKYKLK
mgnify:CR=1 FL=1|tara:strand:+ start:297 stop:821 length:525 start_codon:yes stop_codon:yes gene_type:complete